MSIIHWPRDNENNHASVCSTCVTVVWWNSPPTLPKRPVSAGLLRTPDTWLRALERSEWAAPLAGLGKQTARGGLSVMTAASPAQWSNLSHQSAVTDWGYELRSRLALVFGVVCECTRLCVWGRGSVGGRLSVLLVLQRHQYTLDRPFSYACSQPWLVAGATTAILSSLTAPLVGFLKQRFVFHLSWSNT